MFASPTMQLPGGGARTSRQEYAEGTKTLADLISQLRLCEGRAAITTTASRRTVKDAQAAGVDFFISVGHLETHLALKTIDRKSQQMFADLKDFWEKNFQPIVEPRARVNLDVPPQGTPVADAKAKAPRVDSQTRRNQFLQEAEASLWDSEVAKSDEALAAKPLEINETMLTSVSPLPPGLQPKKSEQHEQGNRTRIDVFSTLYNTLKTRLGPGTNNPQFPMPIVPVKSELCTYPYGPQVAEPVVRIDLLASDLEHTRFEKMSSAKEKNVALEYERAYKELQTAILNIVNLERRECSSEMQVQHNTGAPLAPLYRLPFCEAHSDLSLPHPKELMMATTKNAPHSDFITMLKAPLKFSEGCPPVILAGEAKRDETGAKRQKLTAASVLDSIKEESVDNAQAETVEDDLPAEDTTAKPSFRAQLQSAIYPSDVQYLAVFKETKILEPTEILEFPTKFWTCGHYYDEYGIIIYASLPYEMSNVSTVASPPGNNDNNSSGWRFAQVILGSFPFPPVLPLWGRDNDKEFIAAALRTSLLRAMIATYEQAVRLINMHCDPKLNSGWVALSRALQKRAAVQREGSRARAAAKKAAEAGGINEGENNPTKVATSEGNTRLTSQSGVERAQSIDAGETEGRGVQGRSAAGRESTSTGRGTNQDTGRAEGNGGGHRNTQDAAAPSQTTAAARQGRGGRGGGAGSNRGGSAGGSQPKRK